MNIQPIARIHTPFSDKFAIPRQANIVKEAIGSLYFTEAYRRVEALDGLSAHSHYWLIWGFHKANHKNHPLTARPPRLGGNTHVGVFATRSPFRPNHLGLSVVKLENIVADDFMLTLSGVDMLNDTPIYDIKPYIPYADRCKAAQSTWANESPEPVFRVEFLPDVKHTLVAYDRAYERRLLALVTALLTYDARPAYKAAKPLDEKTYATTLYDVDIAWQINGKVATVVAARLSGNEEL